MKQRNDLSELRWTLAGYTPYAWEQETTHELGLSPKAEIPGLVATVPMSVQQALRNADLLPDWNAGLNHRACEWVEHRHWVFTTEIPDDRLQPGRCHRLHCLGLDYGGVIRLNAKTVYEFANSMTPHVVDLTSHLEPSGNVLQIVFTFPPQWLGTPHWTSKIEQWKFRFNYTWDWIPRMVQIGVWDDVYLEVCDVGELGDIHLRAEWDAAKECGSLWLRGETDAPSGCQVDLRLADGGRELWSRRVAPEDLAAGVDINDLAVQAWWPNRAGDQRLYDVAVELVGGDAAALDRREFQAGFKSVEWRPCRNAHPNADPWLCVVNGQEIFLRGVNWSPILPNFADVPVGEYRRRLECYRDLNMNCLRVNGVGILEKECFYRLCDELGLLIWQEFPLSCSGMDNDPPRTPKAIDEMGAIARGYIRRRRHHASLLMWSGGNELMVGDSVPVTTAHPMIAHLQQVVADEDPGRRFVPGSASGPTFYCGTGRRDEGIHWDVHGPWEVMDCRIEDWEAKYWAGDDALFRSEVGAPGPSPVALIEKYRGDLDAFPCTIDNPLWRRTSWWLQWPVFVRDVGREPESLEEFVAWGQAHQAEALRIAARSCLDRFPEIGGILFWHGHDCFPCTANTAMIDFEGEPKPAALAVGEVFADAKR